MNDPGEYEGRHSSLLADISNAMVRAQKEYFGKGPTSAKAYMLDDFLIIGQAGSLPTTANSTDQAGLYDALTPLFDNVTAGDVNAAGGGAGRRSARLARERDRGPDHVPAPPDSGPMRCTNRLTCQQVNSFDGHRRR